MPEKMWHVLTEALQSLITVGMTAILGVPPTGRFALIWCGVCVRRGRVILMWISIRWRLRDERWIRLWRGCLRLAVIRLVGGGWWGSRCRVRLKPVGRCWCLGRCSICCLWRLLRYVLRFKLSGWTGLECLRWWIWLLCLCLCSWFRPPYVIFILVTSIGWRLSGTVGHARRSWGRCEWWCWRKRSGWRIRRGRRRRWWWWWQRWERWICVE